MAANHPDDYWQGVALSLEGESRKASTYITHNLSLGLAREAILRRILINETPHRFKVQTGLVRHTDADPVMVSKQCDLLVHEPGIDPPLYQVDEFVVVPQNTARFVIEVKSNLGNQEEFNDLLDKYDSIMPFTSRVGWSVPLFGYAFEGVLFNTFVGYVQDTVNNNRLSLNDDQRHFNWPICVAVHGRNYIGFRPTRQVTGGPFWFCVLDFNQAVLPNSAAGFATALFFQFYYELLNNRPLQGEQIRACFNKMPLPADRKVWVSPDGVVHQGNIP